LIQKSLHKKCINSQRAGEELNIQRTLKYLKFFNDFMKEIEESLDDHLQFWTVLLDALPDTKKLNLCGKYISAQMKKIRDLYLEMSSNDSLDEKFLYLYAVFLKLVAHNEIEFNMILSKIQTTRARSAASKLSKSRANWLSTDNKTTMIIKASGERNSLCRILDVNHQTTMILKFQKKDLIGEHAKILMPSVIAPIHDQWVLNYYQTLRETFIKSGHCFLRRKDNYFIFCKLKIQLIPLIDEGIQFIIFIAPANVYEIFSLPFDIAALKKEVPDLGFNTL
jgi:hypothetical protein